MAIGNRFGSQSVNVRGSGKLKVKGRGVSPVVLPRCDASKAVGSSSAPSWHSRPSLIVTTRESLYLLLTNAHGRDARLRRDGQSVEQEAEMNCNMTVG